METRISKMLNRILNDEKNTGKLTPVCPVFGYCVIEELDHFIDIKKEKNPPDEDISTFINMLQDTLNEINSIRTRKICALAVIAAETYPCPDPFDKDNTEINRMTDTEKQKYLKLIEALR